MDYEKEHEDFRNWLYLGQTKVEPFELNEEIVKVAWYSWQARSNLCKKGEEMTHEHNDMTLLDYFAAKAMQGLLSNQCGPVQSNSMSGWGFTNCTSDDVAELAYTMAEKMIQARKPK